MCPETPISNTPTQASMLTRPAMVCYVYKAVANYQRSCYSAPTERVHTCKRVGLVLPLNWDVLAQVVASATSALLMQTATQCSKMSLFMASKRACSTAGL